jgi:hypothetical protein
MVVDDLSTVISLDSRDRPESTKNGVKPKHKDQGLHGRTVYRLPGVSTRSFIAAILLLWTPYLDQREHPINFLSRGHAFREKLSGFCGRPFFQNNTSRG